MKQHKEFQYIYNKGKNAHSSSVVLFYLNANGAKKVGFTASKKVGNAVIRNRSKRRFRALFSEYSSFLNDGTYVFVAKTALKETSYLSLKNDFKKVLTKVGALGND
ncbi:ribonuclease P protein component [Sulfurimonas sp. HSL-1716]|uniref:ribonuclease P protein component n=1 Tax=Hydrocurvibacter sulfurireducens TaxID=3131937 RepID=UPI0031F9626C